MLKTHGERVVLLLGGHATTAADFRAAARISAATGAKAFVETFPARLARGRGVPDIPRLGYFAELAQEQLRGTTHLFLAGARSPVTFFAYPNMPSDLVPEGAEIRTLCGRPAGGNRRPTRCARAAGQPEPARTTKRAAEIRQLGLGHRRAAARERDHFRRSQHQRPVAARCDRRVAAARCAHPDRRSDRPGPTGGGRRRHRRAAPAGDCAAGRWQCAVHDFGAVDDGPRTTRHHRRHPQQPRIRDPATRVEARRRLRRGPEGAVPARSVAIPTSTSSPSPKGSVCPQSAPPRRKNWRPNSALRSPSPDPTSSMPRCPLRRSDSGQIGTRRQDIATRRGIVGPCTPSPSSRCPMSSRST